MTRYSKLWQVIAALFVLLNAGGAWYAFALREQMHGMLHLALMALGFVGYLALRLKAELRRRDLPPAEPPNGRVEYLQQSVDAIALEVERIGEAQRFNEKLKAEQKDKPDAAG